MMETEKEERKEKAKVERMIERLNVGRRKIEIKNETQNPIKIGCTL